MTIAEKGSNETGRMKGGGAISLIDLVQELGAECGLLRELIKSQNDCKDREVAVPKANLVLRPTLSNIEEAINSLLDGGLLCFILAQ